MSEYQIAEYNQTAADPGNPQPLYKPGESVVLLHEWARDLPAQTIENVIFDESWGCYTYAFVGKCLRIEEHELSPVESTP